MVVIELPSWIVTAKEEITIQPAMKVQRSAEMYGRLGFILTRNITTHHLYSATASIHPTLGRVTTRALMTTASLVDPSHAGTALNSFLAMKLPHSRDGHFPNKTTHMACQMVHSFKKVLEQFK